MTPTISPAPPELHGSPSAHALPRVPIQAGPPPKRDDLAEYLAALSKHLKLLIALPVVLGLATLTIMLLGPRKYLASAAFIASEPASASGSLGALSSVASQLGIPALSAISSNTATGSAQFYGDLLTSTAILSAVVRTSYDASANDEYGGAPFKGTLLDYLKIKANTPADRETAAMRAVAKNILAVSVDRPTGIVRIQVRTRNRQLSALVARRLLDLVNDFNLRRRQTQAGAEREFDARRTQAALDSLRSCEAALADFRATNIDFSRSPRLVTREGELQRRVSMAQQIYTLIAQRYELANIEAVRNTPVVTVLDSPENLVEAQPRHTAIITLGVCAFGLALAVIIALVAERRDNA